MMKQKFEQSLLIEVKHSNELKSSMPVANMFKKRRFVPSGSRASNVSM